MTMARTRRWLLLAAALVAVGSWAGVRLPRGAAPRLRWTAPQPRVTAAAAQARALRQGGDEAFAGRRLSEARQRYQLVIREHAASRDPQTGEEVARARFRLATTLAARRDFEAARRAYREVRLSYRGTGERDPRLGATLVERAEFEEAVCTAALGQRREAAEAFLRFIGEHPSSALIFAAARRASELGDATVARRAARELKVAAAAYERARRQAQRQAALCGPQALAEVCRSYGVRAAVAELARLAGSNEQGTTLAGLAAAARSRGLSATGVQAAPDNLVRLPRPLIVLARGGHYLVMTEVAGGRVHLDDPSAPGRSVELAVDDLPRLTDGYALVVSRGRPEVLAELTARRGGAR
jgi:tetratricopeptide (TPR) repeat protein